jgi:hypothetical protein
MINLYRTYLGGIKDMRKRLITIACTTAVVLGLATTALAAELPTQEIQEDLQSEDLQSEDLQSQIDFITFKEGTVETLTMPAYAKGSGSVYRDKTVTQDLSYKRIDSGECYTYVITREQKVSRADIRALGTDAAVGCQFGSFDIYSGDTIGFGVDPTYDVIPAEESGVGAPVYLADVSVDGKVYTLSSYQLKTTPFTKESDGYYHCTTVEVVNVPKGYDGFALVTYGLTEAEHQKAEEFDMYDKENELCANVYTQLSTFIDPSHIAYYKFN